MNNRSRSSGKKPWQNTQQSDDDRPPFSKDRIVLASGELPTDLFSQVAEDAAKHVAAWDGEKAGGNASKPTQLRKFYDEICMWDSKSQRDIDRFDEYLPFILMLKAKVAYSQGRKHVEKTYVDILNHCLAELEKNPKWKTLHNLKLFMEAFTGFYKVYGSKN